MSSDLNMGLNPVPNNKFQTHFNLKEFADNNFKFDINGRTFSKQVENNVKEFADNNFKFDINGRTFSKQVENNVGKGEITSTFSFSYNVFKRFVLQTRKTQGLFGKGLKNLQKTSSHVNLCSPTRVKTMLSS